MQATFKFVKAKPFEVLAYWACAVICGVVTVRIASADCLACSSASWVLSLIGSAGWAAVGVIACYLASVAFAGALFLFAVHASLIVFYGGNHCSSCVLTLCAEALAVSYLGVRRCKVTSPSRMGVIRGCFAVGLGWLAAGPVASGVLYRGCTSEDRATAVGDRRIEMVAFVKKGCTSCQSIQSEFEVFKQAGVMVELSACSADWLRMTEKYAIRDLPTLIVFTENAQPEVLSSTHLIKRKLLQLKERRSKS